MEFLSQLGPGFDGQNSSLENRSYSNSANDKALLKLFASYGDFQNSKGVDGDPGPAFGSRQVPCDNLYVRNMPASWSEQDLRDLFSPYGVVQECRILHRGDEIRGAGALIRMNTISAASQAILALNGHVPMSNLKDFNSQPLLVRYADSPEEKARKQLRKEQLANSHHRSLDLPSAQHRLSGKSLDIPHTAVSEDLNFDSGLRSLNSRLSGTFQPFTPQGLMDLGNMPSRNSLFGDQQAESNLESILSTLASSNPLHSNETSPLQSTTISTAMLANNALALNALSNYSLPQNLGSSTTSASSACTSLYIKNLPPEADRLWLYERFAPHGAILSVKVLQEEHSSRCRGVGFVNYSEMQGALNAIQNVNGMKVADKHLHVSLQGSRGRI